jgi:hypothetical protein
VERRLTHAAQGRLKAQKVAAYLERKRPPDEIQERQGFPPKIRSFACSLMRLKVRSAIKSSRIMVFRAASRRRPHENYCDASICTEKEWKSYRSPKVIKTLRYARAILFDLCQYTM